MKTMASPLAYKAAVHTNQVCSLAVLNNHDIFLDCDGGKRAEPTTCQKRLTPLPWLNTTYAVAIVCTRRACRRRSPGREILTTAEQTALMVWQAHGEHRKPTYNLIRLLPHLMCASGPVDQLNPLLFRFPFTHRHDSSRSWPSIEETVEQDDGTFTKVPTAEKHEYVLPCEVNPAKWLALSLSLQWLNCSQWLWIFLWSLVTRKITDHGDHSFGTVD